MRLLHSNVCLFYQFLELRACQWMYIKSNGRRKKESHDSACFTEWRKKYDDSSSMRVICIAISRDVA